VWLYTGIILLLAADVVAVPCMKMTDQGCDGDGDQEAGERENHCLTFTTLIHYYLLIFFPFSSASHDE
jgi:hypothetical protein